MAGDVRGPRQENLSLFSDNSFALCVYFHIFMATQSKARYIDNSRYPMHPSPGPTSRATPFFRGKS